jgi:hypothetical protein
MTSVLGHLTNMDFPEAYVNWYAVDPVELFNAEIRRDCIDPVFIVLNNTNQHLFPSLIRLSSQISSEKLDRHICLLFGPIVIVKAKQLAIISLDYV